MSFLALYYLTILCRKISFHPKNLLCKQGLQNIVTKSQKETYNHMLV